MARLTKSQREWRPGQTKKPAQVKKMFASTVLTLEALVAFFATLATFGHHFNDGSLIKIFIWVLGLLLSLAFIATPAFLSKAWGYTLGWVLQGLLVLTGFALVPMFFIGACFAATYWYAIYTGEKLDRENVQRAREQREWEQRNPV
ncbi:DUF4233 domain-containing protein [uncultured Rothia sp.]|uniref:DUF4233 domain-containing protein n=1 Tax=uncultured Rothia sp. TaxID=316088 RepID=UPI003216E74A